jgi:hypothetical protein
MDDDLRWGWTEPDGTFAATETMRITDFEMHPDGSVTVNNYGTLEDFLHQVTSPSESSGA